MNKYVAIFAMLCLGSLIAARPWSTVNAHLGIGRPADSVQTRQVQTLDYLTTEDSVVIASPIPLNVVLPQAVTDSLVERITRQEHYKKGLEEDTRLLEAEILAVKAERAKKQAILEREQQQLANIEQIEQLLRRQQKGGYEANVSASGKPPAGRDTSPK